MNFKLDTVREEISKCQEEATDNYSAYLRGESSKPNHLYKKNLDPSSPRKSSVSKYHQNLYSGMV